MGTKLVTASADRTARVYNVSTGNCISVLHGIIFIIKDMMQKFLKQFLILKEQKF